MQKYQNSIVIARSSSANGPVVPASGATVAVYNFGTPTLSTIYSDNGVTLKTNPITADVNGAFSFYAADGHYSLQITGSDLATINVNDILLEDPADGNPVVVSTLVATGQVSLGGLTNAESLRVAQASAGSVNRVQVTGVLTAQSPRIGAEGSDTDIDFSIYSKGAGSIKYSTAGNATEQFRVTHTASAVNILSATGAIATAAPALNAIGTDTNIGINYNAKGTGIHTFNTGVTISTGNFTVGTGNCLVNTAGSGLRVKEGSNAKQGTATLAAGSVVVANTSVTATSRIFLTSNADGGTPGWLRVSARSVGVSFTITSSSGTDTSTVAYQIFEPA